MGPSPSWRRCEPANWKRIARPASLTPRPFVSQAPRDQALVRSPQSQDTGKQVSRRWARDIIDFACLLAGSFCARWHTRVVAIRVPRSRAEHAHVLRRSAPVRHALCATTSFIHLRPSARAPVLIDTINGCHDLNTACLSHDSRSSSSYVSPLMPHAGPQPHLTPAPPLPPTDPTHSHPPTPPVPAFSKHSDSTVKTQCA
ncbi:hypothetical protein ACCO45_011492 [Purpureocillium lilacinum]|uniref:Uncharacterized protein n=1 Tax=Purpureocillium lilacinum TaxID=33203 RepID=A0ACC4DAY8_PURLI